MGLKFQNFLKISYFSPEFSKKGKGFFYICVFATLTGTREGEQRSIPVLLFVQVPPPPWVLPSTCIHTNAIIKLTEGRAAVLKLFT